jgi:hypothetical protein
MKFYTIEQETNNICVHASVKEAQAVANAERFSSEATLTKLAAAWPTSRLISIWNTLPGAVPVRKFASRKLAVSRIWKSVQTLGNEPNPAAEPGVPNEAHATSPAQGRRHRTRRTNKRTTDRTMSRTDTILALLRRPEGANLNEIMDATGWQSHSVRGFISGMVRKKMKLSVSSTPDGNGVRKYRIEG